jgi:DNA polymerase-3 subunit alpha
LLKEDDDVGYLERSNQEFSTLGSFVRFHPVKFYQDALKEYNVISSRDLFKLKDGNGSIRIAATIQKKDTRMSARGRFINMQLSDPYGLFEASIFNEETIKLYNDFLNVQQCAIFNCDIQKDEYSIRMIVTSIENMTDFTRDKIYDLKLYLNTDDLPKVLNYLQSKVSYSKVNANIQILIGYNDYFLLNLTLPNVFFLEMQDKAYLEKYDLDRAKKLSV